MVHEISCRVKIVFCSFCRQAGRHLSLRDTSAYSALATSSSKKPASKMCVQTLALKPLDEDTHTHTHTHTHTSLTKRCDSLRVGKISFQATRRHTPEDTVVITSVPTQHSDRWPHPKQHINSFMAVLLRVIKSRRMRWARHVARMKVMRDAYRVWWGNLMECDHFKDQSIDGRIILKRIYKKGMWRQGLVFSGSE